MQYSDFHIAKLLFLPGAGASPAFWKPVADRIDEDWPVYFFAWPGLGNEAPSPEVRGIDDLVAMVLDQMDGPCHLIAQSMGGLVAIKAARAAPHLVQSLVLTGTSGGLPVEQLGGSDWRAEYRTAFPHAAPWILDVRKNLSDRIGEIAAPALLVWGERDEVSPIAVGRRLARLLPHARLEVIDGGAHDFPQTHPAELAWLIEQHLRHVC